MEPLSEEDEDGRNRSDNRVYYESCEKERLSVCLFVCIAKFK